MASLLTAASFAAGCVPVHSTVRADRSGRITDAESGKPIADATVRVESFRVPTPPGFSKRGTLVGDLEVKTDADGRWQIPSDAKWTTGILAADGMPLVVEVHCVFADGYAPAFRNPHKAWLGLALAPGQSVATDHEIETDLKLHPSGNPSWETRPTGQSRCGVPL